VCVRWHAAQLAVSTVAVTCGDSASAEAAENAPKDKPATSTNAATRLDLFQFMVNPWLTARPIRRNLAPTDHIIATFEPALAEINSHSDGDYV
jgi:hypothetical protein